MADINPADGEDVLGEVARSDAADVDAAVVAAKAAYPEWLATPMPKRGDIIRRVGGLLFFVHVNEPLFVERNFCVFQAKVFGVGSAAHGHQNPVVQLLLLLSVQLKFHFDLLAAGGPQPADAIVPS